METITTSQTEQKTCAYCGGPNPNSDTNFCDRLCFEFWYSLRNAQMLTTVLDKILDEHFGAKDANSRRR